MLALYYQLTYFVKAIIYCTIVLLFFKRASSINELVFLLTSLNSFSPVVNISSSCMLVIFWLNLLSNSCFNWLYLEIVSAATLLENLTVFLTSFVDSINSLISSSLTCVSFSCNVLVVTLSNSPFLSSVMFLLKMSILLEEDNKLLSQYSLLTTSFSSIGGCTFVILYRYPSYQYYHYLLGITHEPYLMLSCLLMLMLIGV